MVSKKQKVIGSSTIVDDGTKSRIVSAATELFATKGYDSTSVKDICSKAKVNIAAIHYYFGSKEKLYKQLIQTFGGSRVASVQSILVAPSSAEELRIRLEMFLTESLDACTQQTSLCRIVQMEIELLHSRSEDVFRNTFIKLSETLVSFLTHAKKKNLIAKNVDIRIAAHFLFNQLRQATRADAVNYKYFGFSIRDRAFCELLIKQTVQLFLNGISS